MNATGIIRRIDDLGRVVIPKEIRRKCHIREGDPLEVFLEEDCVCFKKYFEEKDEIEGLRDAFKDLKNKAFEYGGSTQEQRVENLRREVEKKLKDIFDQEDFFE